MGAKVEMPKRTSQSYWEKIEEGLTKKVIFYKLRFPVKTSAFNFATSLTFKFYLNQFLFLSYGLNCLAGYFPSRRCFEYTPKRLVKLRENRDSLHPFPCFSFCSILFFFSFIVAIVTLGSIVIMKAISIFSKSLLWPTYSASSISFFSFLFFHFFLLLSLSFSCFFLTHYFAPLWETIFPQAVTGKKIMKGDLNAAFNHS
ncbi:MAG: hypothetical protein DRJ11_09840 [Candidatus Aminicenantes bacterium]|nr:MAG: hypothetical protein DRJ11_09840 [Candidatus Aminicenantes bacterium]